MREMTLNKSVIIWSIFILLSLSGAFYSWQKFTDAFPVVDMDVETDRKTALDIARQTVSNHGFDLTHYSSSVIFTLDRDVQNFTELEAGGKIAFRDMLKDDLYEPYTWLVRFFREQTEEEFMVRLTPDGTVYGFWENVPEDAPGPTLSQNEARQIVRSLAEEKSVALADYSEVEAFSELQPGGRTDHVFVFERPDITLGEGRYRIRFTVSGDRATQMKQYIDVPEGYHLRYNNMRAANRTIANVGLVAMFIFLGVGGLSGLFFLLKKHAVLWKPAVYWGVLIAFLQVAMMVNQWPILWMNYDTAVSKSGFVLQQIFAFLVSGVGLALVLTVTFAVAEGLSRMAFPNHIRLWNVWNKNAGASKEVRQQTLIGFFSTGIFFAFVTIFYIFVTRKLDWWSPASPLFDPNILANYLPWLSPIAISLQAGFWEEALFRAVPIAGAALLGNRYGGRKWWIGAALIIQALIFGAGHATYPNVPAYARVVELFIPALGFGFIYLRWGFLPAVILHFVYDVVWISLPLFNTSAPGSGLNRLIVIVLALVPLWIILYRRTREGPVDLKEENLNRAEEPEKGIKEKLVELPLLTGRILPFSRGVIVLSGFLFLLIWYRSTNFVNEDPGLDKGRAEALATSEAALAEQGFDLPDSVWRFSALVSVPNGPEGRFSRQIGGETAYAQMMGTFLLPPHWVVRVARFDGDVADRAEEFRIRTDKDGRIIRFTHRLPEARPGPELSESDARSRAKTFLRLRLGLEPEYLKEISAVPAKRPGRTDWTFTWADSIRYPLNEGQGRLSVTISGDRVTDYNRGYVHIPEEWQRNERNRDTFRGLVQGISVVLLFFIIILAVVKAYNQIAHHKLSAKIWAVLSVVIFTGGILHLWNTWPETLFYLNASEPVRGQIFRSAAFGLIQMLVLAVCLPLLILTTRDKDTDHLRDKPSIIIGLAAGFTGIGLLALVGRSLTFYQPSWAYYEPLNSQFPILYLLITRVWIYGMVTVILLYIFRGMDHYSGGYVRNKGAVLLIFILTGLASAALFMLDTFSVWISMGAVLSIWIIWLFRVVYRAMPSVIPFAVLPFFLAESFKQIRYEAYPAVISGEITAMTGMIILAVLLWYMLKIDRNTV
jgi:hypothetical protein